MSNLSMEARIELETRDLKPKEVGELFLLLNLLSFNKNSLLIFYMHFSNKYSFFNCIVQAHNLSTKSKIFENQLIRHQTISPNFCSVAFVVFVVVRNCYCCWETETPNSEALKLSHLVDRYAIFKPMSH